MKTVRNTWGKSGDIRETLRGHSDDIWRTLKGTIGQVREYSGDSSETLEGTLIEYFCEASLEQ